MSILSTEILIPIFLQISISDKLECILVCKRWYIILTENVLYKQLQFSNMDDFNKAIDLLEKKPYISNSVESLTVKKCEIDTVSIFLMPRQFPNIKALSWKENIRPTEERLKHDISIKHLPSPYIYRRELKRWNQLESIDIELERLPFLTMLLESSSFNNLTFIRICFKPWHLSNYFDTQTLSKIRPNVKSLINTIKNAPSLEHLIMECSVLDLDDMEELHASLPKLKKLLLFCTAIYGGSTDNMTISADKKTIINSHGMAIAQNTANTVEELSIVFYISNILGIHNVDGDLKDTMQKWLIYIGCKYYEASITLKGWGDQYLPQIPEFYQPILTILRKMPTIVNYHAFLHPITLSIINTIDSRECKLETLNLYTNVLQSLQAQLHNVSVSNQSKTLYYLKINSKGMLLQRCHAWNNITSSFSKYFSSLITLNITCTIYHCALVELFQSLPSSLQILSLNSLTFDINDDVVMMPLKECKINSLYLTLTCTRTSNMHQMNYTLEYILQSCPYLSDFTLNGQMWSADIPMLKLCFFNHKALRKITIDFKGVQYYTFSWIKGKESRPWADYDELARVTDLTGKKFHIDVSWRNKNLELNLAKAPVVLNHIT